MMEYIVKKTNELDSAEVEQICNVFNRTFAGHHTEPDSFVELYSNTPVGYSFHGLMKSEGAVVGVHNNIPYYYVFDGKRYLFAYGGGTMVLKEYRDFYAFYKLYRATEAYAKENGVAYLFGFPNENSHVLFVKGFKHKDLEPLRIYITPLSVGAVKKKLSPLNPLSKLFSKTMLLMSGVCRSKREYDFLVDKDYSSFYESRFGNGTYGLIEGDGYKAYYKVSLQNGVKTAFLLDVHPLSGYSFNSAVRKMYGMTRKDGVSMLMYVGNLPFRPLTMIELPRKFEPKKFHFTGLILDKDNLDERIYDTSVWNVNLSNYDLL